MASIDALKFVLLTLILIFAPVAETARATASMPMEVRCVGDDGLTLKLRDALEKGFAEAPNFTMSSGKKAGTLVVAIPSNVEWKKVGGRIQILYTVQFASVNKRELAIKKGHCWESAPQ